MLVDFILVFVLVLLAGITAFFAASNLIEQMKKNETKYRNQKKREK